MNSPIIDYAAFWTTRQYCHLLQTTQWLTMPPPKELNDMIIFPEWPNHLLCCFLSSPITDYTTSWTAQSLILPPFMNPITITTSKNCLTTDNANFYDNPITDSANFSEHYNHRFCQQCTAKSTSSTSVNHLITDSVYFHVQLNHHLIFLKIQSPTLNNFSMGTLAWKPYCDHTLDLKQSLWNWKSM